MDNSVQPIYEDIDVRPYIENLFKQWRLIIAVPLVMALVTLGVSSFSPVSYESTALVAVTSPRFQLNPALTEFDPAATFKAYPELATSDDLIADLYEVVKTDLPEDFNSRLDLQGSLEAVNGADPSLIRLTVTMRDPETAAKVTNAWADIFVKRANFVFGNQGEDAVVFFQDQLANAQTQLDEAEAALVSFQASNRQVTLSNELAILSESQTGYQRDLREIRAILEEVRFLQTQLESEAAELTSADVLAGLILQSKVLNIESSGPTNETLQIQLTTDALTPSREGQAALLNSLELLLISKQNAITVELENIDRSILDRQSTLQQISATRSRLENERTIGEETVASLARKVQESRISSQETAAQVQLASQAAVPLEPAGLSAAVKSIIVALVVFMGSVGVSFLHQWWINGRS